MAAPATAKDVLDAKMSPERPGERLRRAVLDRLAASLDAGAAREDALQDLYPSTILDAPVLESVTAALVSGANLLLLGPPGSGKTSLARDVWELFPKDALVVADCPVQDDPFSLVSPAYSQIVPPCPYCKQAHGQVAYEEIGDFDARKVDPRTVPVRKARLREGYGLARIQGSPEVFPDHLTGAVNLAKLEEIGDPNSPLVLEPGKLMQANRGLLLVDEVGKLPRGTQNVLLQAFQESVVTPTKSRETFPASFVGITTSNVDDLELVNEPLLGRLTGVLVGFNEDHAKNRAIVDRALAGAVASAHVGGPYRDAAVRITERWRRTTEGAPDLAEVGSNRTMIDVLRRAEALAALRGARAVAREDFDRAAREAMQGRVRGRSAESYAQNRDAVEAFLAKQGAEAFQDAAVAYWCGFFVDVLKSDKAEGERVVREAREAMRPPDRLEVALEDGKFAKLAKWAAYVDAREGRGRDARDRAARHAAVWQALESSKAFDAAAPR